MARKSKTNTIEFNPKKKERLAAARLGKPYWSGSISFGLVNVPIRLFPGVHEKTVRFHLLHEKDEVRLHQKLVCPAEHDKEVPREETVRGFEIDKNKNVVLTPEEIKVFGSQLGLVLEHVAKLNEVDVAQVEPMAHSFPIYNVFREDEIRPSLDREAALANAPQQANGLFIVTKVVE